MGRVDGPAKSGGGPPIFELLKRAGPSEKWDDFGGFFIFALDNRGGSCIFSATVWGVGYTKIVFQLSDFSGPPSPLLLASGGYYTL